MTIDAAEKLDNHMIVKSTDNSSSTLDTIVTAEEGQKFVSKIGSNKRQILPFQSL